MAGIFKRALQIVEDNKARRDSGLLNCIPFGYERLAPYLPGLQKKNYTIITASTGVGKSKYTKAMYVLRPYEFVQAYPDMGFKFKTFYFCLEESKENFIHSLMCYKLYTDWSMRVSVKELKSYTSVLTAEVAEKVRNMHLFFEEFEESVTIIDNVKNPFGIYKNVLDYVESPSVGAWSKKVVNYNGENKVVNDVYSMKHPDHYVQVIVDHVSLIHAEKKHNNLHEAITELSSSYAIDLRDKFGCTVTFVQQQSADKEKQQYTFKGASIESKLEPSLDGLADNKLTGRDADEVLGLFAPDRYEIPNHRGYDIAQLADNYRGLILLKQRDGDANIRAGLLFDGATNHFEELKPADMMRDEDYQLYLSKVGRGGPRLINFG